MEGEERERAKHALSPHITLASPQREGRKRSELRALPLVTLSPRGRGKEPTGLRGEGADLVHETNSKRQPNGHHVLDLQRTEKPRPITPTQPPPIGNSSKMSSLENKSVPLLFSGVGVRELTSVSS